MSTPGLRTEDDLGAVFARYVIATNYRDLPPDAVRAAKQSTLDTLGVILGASGLQDAIPEVVDLMKEWGGIAESTVMGFGGKLPAPSAAFVNGAMAHGLDFDDHLPEGHHPSSSLVPALFAVAERLGGVSGEEFITAMAIGQDIFARLRKYVAWKQDWFMTPVIGAFAAAAACAKLLKLSESQVLSAFGIASMQSAGTMQLAYGTGGGLRGNYAGFAAKAGVFSAYLAQAGVTGTTAPFEGKAGFLEVYFDNDYNRDAMVADLGTRFEGSTIVYKLWPSCGASHGYIAASMQLLGAAGRGDEIEHIDVIGGDFAKRLSEPIEKRRRPASILDAKFSIPYTVALAVARGRVGLGDFAEESRTDPQVVAVADKISFVEDSRFDWSEELPPSAVRITLKSGEQLEAEVSHGQTPGSTERPLSWDDLVTKFVDCATYSIRPLRESELRRIVAEIRELETVADVSVIIESLG
ncbi:MmgE/PrpD family protein [Microbacterium pygmaeum]|uniref:2-methylcitrate dehydratase PrpD n=1 Tax=Microbacterium pygmaeum TaxID=370764 RepID=A0A1G7XB06_9MICO|nr:MmgE/PrpD family protein [Microbacterium pygmaeum]SDG81389.1 2-methylcitrate dehydratase PrpD [Microbacterium pygmaeum]